MRGPLDVIIETSRLRLRRLAPADAPRLAEIQANWNVTRNLAAATFPSSLDDMRHWLAGHETEWSAGRAYRFSVICDDAIVGCADIDTIEGDQGELGYWLDEPWWGRGFASEAGAALVDFARDTLRLRRLVAGHAADNPASGRVLRKLGFRWREDAAVWSNPRQATIAKTKYTLDLVG
ncbi:MAG: GNAT family N-acetyltransferase [Alphaproteobacteria bacterium]